MAKSRRKNGEPTERRLPAEPLQVHVANLGDRRAAELLGVDESRLRHFAEQDTVQVNTVIRWCGRLRIGPETLYPDIVTNGRPDITTWLFEEAEHAARRSTCPRASVGAVLTRDDRVISHGYNGAPPGQPHCTEVGCDLGPDGGCRRTVHAEMNAIAFAARYGTRTEGAELWCTHSPCQFCAKLIVAAGIVKVYAKQAYRDSSGAELLESMGVPVMYGDLPTKPTAPTWEDEGYAVSCTICRKRIVGKDGGSLVCEYGHRTVDRSKGPVAGIDNPRLSQVG